MMYVSANEKAVSLNLHRYNEDGRIARSELAAFAGLDARWGGSAR
jgi:hypothetical protein